MSQDYQFRQWITAYNVARLIKYDGLAQGHCGYDSQRIMPNEDDWLDICEQNDWNPDEYIVEYHCEQNPNWNGTAVA